MNKGREYEVMKATGRLPEEMFVSHKGTHGCAVISLYLFDLFQKIRSTATPEQVDKYNELQDAYVAIVNDLSHIYRLEYTVDRYHERLRAANRRIAELEKENDKLLKTLEFQEG